MIHSGHCHQCASDVCPSWRAWVLYLSGLKTRWGSCSLFSVGSFRLGISYFSCRFPACGKLDTVERRRSHGSCFAQASTWFLQCSSGKWCWAAGSMSFVRWKHAPARSLGTQPSCSSSGAPVPRRTGMVGPGTERRSSLRTPSQRRRRRSECQWHPPRSRSAGTPPGTGSPASAWQHSSQLVEGIYGHSMGTWPVCFSVAGG